MLDHHRQATVPGSFSPAFSRRALLAGATAAGFGALAAPSPGWTRLRDPQREPFTLGVASGDPAPDGVVLWTRLAPDPFDPDGGMPDRPAQVHWQVAHDDRFTRVVRAGTVTTTAARAHAVHVEVAGLKPARWYHYRFRVGRHISEEDVDLVVRLGDYIYEGEISAAGTEDTPGYVRAQLPPELVRPAPRDLTQYRLRHALYRSDPQLQAAHAAVPWALTWDDHEVAPNWGPTARPSPASRRNSSPGAWPRLVRRTTNICRSARPPHPGVAGGCTGGSSSVTCCG